MLRNPALGTLSTNGASLMADAKSRLSQAADSLTAAVLAIEAEKGDFSQPQSNEFINLDAETCSWDPTYWEICSYDAAKTQAVIADIKQGVTEFKDVLNNPLVFNQGTTNEFTINFFNFFNGVGLRESLPVNFPGTPTGDFQDPSLGGIIDPLQININEDLNLDGTPDILQ